MSRILITSLAITCALCGCKKETDQQQQGPEAGYSKEEALARLRVVNDLQLMAHGMHNYASANDLAFPPADGMETEIIHFGKTRIRGVSWRAMILPFVSSDRNEQGQEKSSLELLQNAAKLSKEDMDTWNRPELKGKHLYPFAPQDKSRAKEPWHTYYRVFVGNGAAFEPGKRLKLGVDFPDGAANTLLIVEASDAVPWPKPDELTYDPTKPLPKLGGQFPDGFYAAFADGELRFIKNGTDEKTIRAMITRNGNDNVGELPPAVNIAALRKAAGLPE